MKKFIYFLVLTAMLLTLMLSGCGESVVQPPAEVSAEATPVATPMIAATPTAAPTATISPTPAPTEDNPFAGISGSKQGGEVVGAGDHVYYSSLMACTVMVFNLDGSSNVFPDVVTHKGISQIICERDFCLYYTENVESGEAYYSSAISKSVLGGDTCEYIYQHPDKTISLYPLGCDDAYIYVYYFTDYNSDAESKTILRIAFDGSGAEEVGKVTARDIIFSGGKLYYSDYAKATITAMDADGTKQKTLYKGKRAHSLCVQDGWLYFAIQNDEDIFRVSLESGDLQRIGEAKGTGLEVAGGYIYYANTLDFYRLYRVSTEGGAPEKLHDVSNVYDIYVYEGRVYFTYQQSNGIGLVCSFLDGTGRKDIV